MMIKINKTEKNRILEMHKTAIKKNSIKEQSDPPTTDPIDTSTNRDGFVNCEDVLGSWESPQEGMTGGSSKLTNVTIESPAAGISPTAERQYKIYKDGKYFCSLNVKI